MIQAADASWERGDSKQCFDMLERAGRLDPGNPKMQLYMGQRYGLRYNYAAAERCFEQAVRIAPHKTETLAIAGRLSLDFGSHRMAEDYFRRAVEQKDALPDTVARLAEVYERLNRMEDAAKLVEQALQLDDHCARAQVTRARLYGRTGRLQEAEQLLRSFLSTTVSLDTNDRQIQIRCHYELGKNLDQQGRYDEAMTAFLDAKALLLPTAKPLIAQMKVFRDRLKDTKANLSAETLQRWFDCAPALSPAHRLAFLGGHPRSGTTLLEQVLDSHPDIVSVEETAIFLEDACTSFRRDLQDNAPTLSVLDRAPTGALRQSRTNYFYAVEMFLGKPVGNRMLIEKNPSLTFMIPALVRVFPEIKLIVALRDPRDVCLSCLMQPLLPLRQGSSAYLSLESTVEEYAAMMSLWQTLAPLLKNPFLEVRYEDMVNDLESVARKTLDFLGVPWDARVLGFDEHARQKVVRSPTYADVTQPVHKGAIGRWRNYRKYFEPHLEKLEPFVKAFGYE
jgi:tetratricopeptide (TPR) repeat protein